MALTFNIRDDRSVTLEEYVEYVKSEVDVNDVSSIAASAPIFRRLLNNRTLLADHVNKELRSWRDFQSGNTYTAQTLILWMDHNFFIRANVWAPKSAHKSVAEKEQDLYFYGRAHDHNFTFMTGGYFGTGYETHIYEYDPETINGNPGEGVDVGFLETTRLPAGKIMLYRESTDIHEQGYPEDYSVSFNLMTQRKEGNKPRKKQLFFDLDKGLVLDDVEASGGRVMVMNLAKLVGNSRSATLLGDICEVHPDARVRSQAADALTTIQQRLQ